MFGLNKSKAPRWAGDLDNNAYMAFKDKVVQASQGKIDPDKTDKQGIVNFEGVIINMTNLAGLCAGLDQSDWNTEIQRWVSAFTSGMDRPDPVYPSDLHMLKLQLYPGNYFDQFKGDDTDFIRRTDIPGTLTTVVVDWPDMVSVLKDTGDKLWLNHQDKIFKELLDQLRQETPNEVSFISSDAGSDNVIAMIEGEEITTATQALVLDKLYPQLIGSHGALVSVPFRHMILAKRLDAEPTAETIDDFRGLTVQMAGQTNFFISDQVYKFKNGKFSTI